MTEVPSRRSLSTYAGVGAAAVGLVGYAVMGWRFGGTGTSASAMLGALVAALAVAVAVRRRTG